MVVVFFVGVFVGAGVVVMVLLWWWCCCGGVAVVVAVVVAGDERSGKGLRNKERKRKQIWRKKQ